MAEKPVALTRTNAQRISRVVRAVERSEPPRADVNAPDARLREKFYAEITGESGARYSWKRMTPSDGELVDSVPAYVDATFSAQELSGAAGVPVGTRVEMQFVGYNTAGTEARYLFAVGGASDEGEGQYKGMNRTMLTTLQKGWGFPVLLPVP